MIKNQIFRQIKDFYSNSLQMKQNKSNLTKYFLNHNYHQASFMTNQQNTPDYISQAIIQATQQINNQLTRIRQFGKSHKYLKQPPGCQILNYYQSNLHNRLFNIKVEQFYVKLLLLLNGIKMIDFGKGKQAQKEFTMEINLVIAENNKYQAQIKEAKQPYERMSTGHGIQTQSLNNSRVLSRELFESAGSLGQIFGNQIQIQNITFKSVREHQPEILLRLSINSQILMQRTNQNNHQYLQCRSKILKSNKTNYMTNSYNLKPCKSRLSIQNLRLTLWILRQSNYRTKFNC